MLAIIFWSSPICFGQSSQLNDRLGAGMPPSPQAASLGKFAQTPVSLYTGIPSISIPIYEVKLRGVTLPIGLNYHAGGIRVTETSGPVGLGWALQAGGVLAPTIIGKNDLAYMNSQGTGLVPFPTNRPLGPVTSADDYEFCMAVTGARRVNQPNNIYNSTGDTQPDLWYYNFCGRSGKFFHTLNDEVGHSMPFEPLIIHRDNHVAGYTITNEAGNLYLFRAAELTSTTIQVHGRMVNPQEDLQPRSQAFYLTRIVTPYHESITLTYDTLSYWYKNIGNFTRYAVTPVSAGPPNACVNKPTTSTDGLTKISGVQLASIRSSRGDYVEFRYSSCERLDVHRGRALEHVLVHQGNTTRDFAFDYRYFGLPLATAICGPSNPELNVDDCRLKLFSVTEVGKPSYRLLYNENTPLPSRLSAEQDHWGFFNGHTQNTNLLPAAPEMEFYQGADREPDSIAVLSASLKALYYPTGGRTEFDFEPNRYYSPSTTSYEHHVVEPVAFYAGRDDDSTPDPL